MADSLTSLLGRLDLWIDIGRGLIDLALIYAMYLVVMTVLGHPKPWKRSARPGSSAEAGAQQRGGPEDSEHKTAARAPQSARHELHLEILDTLKQTRQLQGATIVLVVFAVVILAINGVLNGAETATILAGITGYVLGTRQNAHDHEPNGRASDGDRSGGSGELPPTNSGDASTEQPTSDPSAKAEPRRSKSQSEAKPAER